MSPPVAAPGGMSIGLVGCGRWGTLILRDLLALGCRVEVAAPSNATQARALALGATRAVRCDVDFGDIAGVVVAAPTPVRPAIVTRVLARGVPVMTEKPLSDRLVPAKALARAGGSRLFVMDKWRYHPGIRALARLAREAELGPVTGVHSWRLGWRGSGHDADPTWTLLPHDLCIVIELLGRLPPARYSIGACVGNVPVDLLGVLGPEPHVVIEVSARHATPFRLVRLECRDGVAYFDGAVPDAISLIRHHDLGAPAPIVERRPVAGDQPLLAELRAFVRHLGGGPAPVSPVVDGLAAVQTIDALHRLAGF